MGNKSIVLVIDEYVALQSQLVETLKNDLGERNWKLLSDVPRHGEIILGDEVWDYHLHGTGVTFKAKGVSVDMTNHLEDDSEFFHSDRIVEYLKSINQNVVSFKGKSYDVDYDEIEILLHEMYELKYISKPRGKWGLLKKEWRK